MPKLIPALCTLAALGCLGASSLPAETIYATSENTNTYPFNNLFSFDSATPGVITTPRPITGLNGILTTLAFRPADGQLYAESGYEFFRIDPATAQATRLFTIPQTSGLATMAFNPVTGLLRVISTQGEANTLSFRVNVDTGAVIQDGQSSQPRGLAYTNNYAGASATTLYALNGASLTYLTIDNPENQSRFTIVGPVGASGVPPAVTGLSISGVTGTAYASFTFNVGTSGPYSSQFYTVDLNTGAGTLVGPIGNGTLYVEAIAAPVGSSQVAPVPEPTSWGLLGAGLLFGGVVRRWRARDSAVS